MTDALAHSVPPPGGTATGSDLIERFEVAWRGGTPPRIEEFLRPASGPGAPGPAGPSRAGLLAELVKIDLEYRWRGAAREPAGDGAGPGPDGPLPDRPRLEHYLARFSDLGSPDQLSVDLVAEEYRVRRRWGDRPGHAEYLERFAPLGSNLRAGLDAVDADLAAETSDDGLPPLAAVAGPAELPPPVARVGRYALGGLLGAGGFGSVWRARDTELGRDVAIKLPRGGWFGGPAEEERFLREARSAAQLRHPGIIPVHDAGRDRGTLFIVSELAHGESLARRLERGPLGFREAAELISRVADALDYAHRNGVVHRDLKPSNILIEEDDPRPAERGDAPEAGRGGLLPRLTDFGLAKRDSDETTMTLDGQLLGTPAYMSPEQFRAPHAVDGRSDVYSLGVILYLLLTSELPFRGATRMLQLQVMEDEPRPPRRLNDRIPRDLETITLRCLAKEPARRYATARDLGDDLRRFLDGEPVRARPVGPAERLRLRCRRNPLAAGLVAALFLASAGGFLGVTWQWLRADRQHVLAERSFREALQTVDDYLTRISENTLLDRPGLEPLRKELLEQALKYYQGFMASRGGDPTVRAELASAQAKVAKITAAIGSQREAVSAYERALREYEGLMRDRPDEAAHVRGLAEASSNLGTLLVAAGRPSEARASYERALRLYESLTRGPAADSNLRRDLAGVSSNLGVLEEMTGHPEEALAHDERARDLEEALAREEPTVARHRSALANTRSNLGVLHYGAGRVAEAKVEYERARDLQEVLVRDHPNIPAYRSDLANTCSNLGVLLRGAGRQDEARSSYERARDLQEGLVRDHPAVTAFRAELARTLDNLGRLHQVGGHPDEALAAHDRARVLRERLVLDNPGDWEARSFLGSTMNNLGITLADLGRPGEALDALRRGIALQRAALTGSDAAAQCRRFLSLNQQDLARVLRSLGRAEEAAAVTRERLDLWPDHPVELYNAACELALCVPLVGPGHAGRDVERRRYTDLAIEVLRRSVRAGFRDIKSIMTDPDLEPIRSCPAYRLILKDATMPAEPFNPAPSPRSGPLDGPPGE